MRTHILFDFFGTLVDYSESRTDQGYEGSHALLQAAGADLDYAGFLDLWSRTCESFDAAAKASLVEYSMQEVASAFLRRALGRRPQPGLVSSFVTTYLTEWNTGVHPIEGVPELLERLSRDCTLAVVTNTHEPSLVPGHLDRLGVSHVFCEVVTSVEHRRRKPDPSIFHHAVSRLETTPDRCLYVGDDFDADYRGATSAGIACLLIDPQEIHPLPPGARLASILALEGHLKAR